MDHDELLGYCLAKPGAWQDEAHVMAYIGRYGWNTLNVGGAISDDEIREAVDASYAEVVSRLPKAQRPSGKTVEIDVLTDPVRLRRPDRRPSG